MYVVLNKPNSLQGCFNSLKKEILCVFLQCYIYLCLLRLLHYLATLLQFHPLSNLVLWLHVISSMNKHAVFSLLTCVCLFFLEHKPRSQKATGPKRASTQKSRTLSVAPSAPTRSTPMRGSARWTRRWTAAPSTPTATLTTSPTAPRCLWAPAATERRWKLSTLRSTSLAMDTPLFQTGRNIIIIIFIMLDSYVQRLCS